MISNKLIRRDVLQALATAPFMALLAQAGRSERTEVILGPPILNRIHSVWAGWIRFLNPKLVNAMTPTSPTP
jgi:hypothetical protein